ncbi:depupylase/deamidase Dop [Actinomyces minihominis]|uniref:depupylase/deamidase Dop n=1 Tax=Actinomyces minihominis TaxID=2002838 RepID=UPI000C0767A6|nr:depupylase/deamidase Dop [Actinomyces minihominis]
MDSGLKPNHAARVMGTETEFGIYRPGEPGANAIALSTEAVSTYAQNYRHPLPAVSWDYRGEDPLNDIRGIRLDRANVDPSLLTDDPYHLAPSGGSENLPVPGAEERRLFSPTSIVLTNGARFYVDHAHPEYSSPESLNALDAVLWDKAGDEVARRVMKMREDRGEAPLVLLKNNVDGKGATYGSHENYQVERAADLDDLIRFSIPFLVTRQIFCGSGRVGLGQRSERAGFQISQRADYVENDIGLETTFNRPIFNTRDEPHANHHFWRRVHVIGGDANLFDVSALLRLGTTSLVLRAIEAGTTMEWENLDIDNPVEAVQEVSGDLTLKRELTMRSGESATALHIQRRYRDLVIDALEGALSEVDQQVVRRWGEVLDLLEEDPLSAAAQVEWVGKYLLLDRQRTRLGVEWDDPRIIAMDLQWSDLRPEKSLVEVLRRAGMVEELFSEEQISAAADTPPPGTRALVRGNEVRDNPHLEYASWTSLVSRHPSGKHLVRVPLADPASTSSNIQ